MIPDGTHTAVLDRFEDTQESRVAVLVVEGPERPLGDLRVEPSELPEAARQQDAVIRVTIEDGALREATYEEEATRERRESAQSRFDRLARRPPGGDEDEEGEQ
jgi:hypothetical protein